MGPGFLEYWGTTCKMDWRIVPVHYDNPTPFWEGTRQCRRSLKNTSNGTRLYSNYYDAGKDVGELPCGGCKSCQRAHEQWSRFEEDIDDVVSLAVRETKCCMEDSKSDKVTEESNWCWSFSQKELREAQKMIRI